MLFLWCKSWIDLIQSNSTFWQDADSNDSSSPGRQDLFNGTYDDLKKYILSSRYHYISMVQMI